MFDDKEYQKKTDSELVAMILENSELFGILVRRYEEKIFRYLMRIFFMPKEDAEDILQSIFLKVYRNLNDFDRDLKFSSWVYRIAHNEAISHFRKKKIRPHTVSIDDSPSLVKHITSGENITCDLEKNCTKEEIAKVLECLDEKYREVLVLKFLEDKDYQEISDILERPMGTVATLISRAKKQFREYSCGKDIEF